MPMKTLITLIALTLAAATMQAATLTVRPLSTRMKPRAVQTGSGFSVDLPVVGRVRNATTTFFTALDVTNNTSSSTDVVFTWIPADGGAARSGLLTTLGGFDNLHVDDFVAALSSAGLVSRPDNVFGTLLLTFTNAAFRNGTEATAIARVYSFVSGTSGPTFGLAYRAPALQTNGAHSLSSILRSGSGMVTNLGIENVGIDDAGNSDDTPVTVRLSFFDPSTGSLAGEQPSFTLAAGQVMQLNDVAKSNLIVFVDEIGGTAQIRGYAVMKDTATNDGSLVFMQESPAKSF
jgi:hypothetical protein